MQAQPYVFFEGRCQEALEFYRRALGAEIMAMMRYKESPDPGMIQPGTEDKVMHAAFKVGETTVFASDGRASGQRSCASGVDRFADDTPPAQARATRFRRVVPSRTRFCVRAVGHPSDR